LSWTKTNVFIPITP